MAILPGSIDWIFRVLIAGFGKVLGKVGKCRALHVKAGRLEGQYIGDLGDYERCLQTYQATTVSLQAGIVRFFASREGA